MLLVEDSTLYTIWAIGLAVVGVVVVLVAVLAVVILATAVRIKRTALKALASGESIRRRTLPLWQLETTNQVAAELLEAARSIEAHGNALAAALEHHGVPQEVLR